MRKPDRTTLRALRNDAAAIRRAVGFAMRRPSTYPGFAREALWAGMNLALYPAGLLSEALKIEDEVRLGDKFSRRLPLRYLDPEAAATPIILLHGALHNRSAFTLMRRALRRSGFRTVMRMNYNVIGHDVADLAGRLSGAVEDVLACAGATRAHIVGHSLGGLVARYYIQEMDGHEKVHTLVTLGTPHQGTYAAWAARGRAARQLRPGSGLLETLKRSARPMPVRFISFYSNLDTAVLPPSHAKIAEPDLRARNILVKDIGHLSLLISRPVVRAVAEILSTLDEPAAEVRALTPPLRMRARGARAEGA